MELNALLKMMVEHGASDLHLKVGRTPILRIKGELVSTNGERLSPEQIERMANSIMNDQLKKQFQEVKAVDMGYSLPGVARFRTNIYCQRGSPGIAFRNVPYEILSLEELELPDVMRTFCDKPQGLVLITGPTGSGKSTTLAALVRHINETRNVHIVTVEDPIEFLFKDDKAAINQREVGTDTPSFAIALRNVLRQDPDVIMVGEMRDLETISTVMTAAETGHLVFSTLHTNDCSQTIDRIVDSFPQLQQSQIRVQLSQVLLGVVSQQLVSRTDGTGRIAASEILIASPKAKKLIIEGKSNRILEEIESSVNYYKMQSMNQSLIALVANNVVTKKEAMLCSTNPGELELNLTKLLYQDKKEGKDLSRADYTKIAELEEMKKLVHQHEAKMKDVQEEKDTEVSSKNDIIANLERDLKNATAAIQKLKRSVGELNQEKQDILNTKDKQIRELKQDLYNLQMQVEEAKNKRGLFR